MFALSSLWHIYFFLFISFDLRSTDDICITTISYNYKSVPHIYKFRTFLFLQSKWKQWMLVNMYYYFYCCCFQFGIRLLHVLQISNKKIMTTTTKTQTDHQILVGGVFRSLSSLLPSLWFHFKMVILFEKRIYVARHNEEWDREKSE